MIYLDHNASTPLDPRVWDKMKLFLMEGGFNPSSVHQKGRQARAQLIEAREHVAQVVGGGASVEVLFTSSATEALNTALLSVDTGKKIVTSSIEHSAVLETCRFLETKGVEVIYLQPKSGQGVWDVEELERHLDSKTTLVALSAANHETGIVQPFKKAAQICAEKRIPFLLDAVGLLGRAPFIFPEGNVGVVLSSHKIYGPMGAGALVYTKSFPLKPLLHGGGQEKKLRAGTENMAAIIGLAAALGYLPNHEELLNLQVLRDHFEQSLAQHFPVKVVGKDEKRVCNTSTIIFPGIDAEWLFMELDLRHICVSFGSACSSNSRIVSHVLTALRFSQEERLSALRFSFGRTNTMDEVNRTVQVLAQLLSKCA